MCTKGVWICVPRPTKALEVEIRAGGRLLGALDFFKGDSQKNASSYISGRTQDDGPFPYCIHQLGKKCSGHIEYLLIRYEHILFEFVLDLKKKNDDLR